MVRRVRRWSGCRGRALCLATSWFLVLYLGLLVALYFYMDAHKQKGSLYLRHNGASSIASATRPTLEAEYYCNNYSTFDPDIVSTMSEMARHLHKAQRHVRGTKTSDSLREANKLMNIVLKYVGIDKDQLLNRKAVEPQSVCPEKYMGSQYGYPLFYHGFEETTCPYTKHISTLLTVVAFFNEDNIGTLRKNVNRFAQSIIEQRSNVTVYIATVPEIDPLPKLPSFIHVIKVINEETNGQIWNTLISQVTTPYVLIARDAETITEDARLERLVREIEMLQVPVAAGAVRYPDGHWKKGCYQSVHRNFTVRYLEGYDESMHECLFCDYSDGPFVALTNVVKSIPFIQSKLDGGLFEDWFLRLTKKRIETIVCPDSMFHISFNKKRNQDWVPFMEEWGLYKYISPQGQTVISDCSHTADYNGSRALSPCKLNTNAFAVKYVLKACETNNIFCEPQEGTSLGALKLGKTLPWEWDSDLGFLSENFTALLALGELLTTQNFKILKTLPDILILGYEGWNVEMYGQYRLDSASLAAVGVAPTRLLLDGAWLRAPRNPGLFSRNRFGRHIYRHAVHWRNLGRPHGWDQYQTGWFPPCDRPDNHDCLDRYNGDGDLQFGDPLP